MRSPLALALLLIGLVSLSQLASGAEPTNSLQVGIGGANPMPDCTTRIYTMEYEHRYTPTIAILGIGSSVTYTSDESDYLEDGSIHGLDLGLRYYANGVSEGFYTGGSVGYWKGEWDFTKYRYTANERKGEADTDAFRVNLELGYRHMIQDTTLSVIPKVNIGQFFSTSSCDYTAPASQVGMECDQKSVVNGYIFAAINLGFDF